MSRSAMRKMQVDVLNGPMFALYSAEISHLGASSRIMVLSMKTHRRLRRLASAFLAAIVITVPCIPSFAQPVEQGGTEGPFQLYMQSMTWMQRNPTLKNNGPADQRVRLVMISNDAQGRVTQFSRVVEVPANSTRQAWMVFRSGPLPEQVRRSGTGRTMRQLTYRIENADTGQLIKSEFIGGQQIEASELVMAVFNTLGVVGNDDSYFKDMTHLGSVIKPGGMPGILPDVWYGYDLIDVLMLGACKRSELRPSQVQAILDWVRRGGTLVIASAEPLGDLLAGPLGEAAGVSCVGVHHVDSMSVVRLKTGAAKDESLGTVGFAWPMPMGELAIGDAQVLYEANDLPMLTRRQLGLGQIMVLSVPVGALNAREASEDTSRPAAPGLHAIFSDIAPTRRAMVGAFDAERFFADEDGDGKSLAHYTLEQVAGRRGPGTSVPVGLVLGIAVLVVAAGVVLGLRRRTELIWVALVPLALGGGAGLYFYGHAQATPEQLSHISLIQGVGEGQAVVRQACLYYSGTEGRSFEISGGQPRIMVEPLSSATDSLMGLTEYRIEGPLVIKDQKLAANSSTAFMLDGITAVKPLTASLSLGENGLVGTIENHLPAEITNCVLYADGRTYRVGSLAAGASTPVRLGAQELLPPGAEGLDFIGQMVRSKPDTLKNALANQLLSKTTVGQHVSRQPLLVGFVPYNPTSPISRMTAQSESGGWSMVVWPVELAQTPAGQRVLVPAGISEFDVIGGIWSRQQRQFIESQQGSVSQLKLTPPAELGELAEATITLQASLQARGYSLEIVGKTPAGSVVSIGQWKDPAGSLTIQVPQAQRFRDAQGVYSLELRTVAEDRAANRTWKINSLDAVLEGTTR